MTRAQAEALEAIERVPVSRLIADELEFMRRLIAANARRIEELEEAE